ncbi:hypothetical protein D3C86_1801850 [compost metagenome]
MPTHGAKLPSMPMLIELGIKAFANTCASLVSSINAPVSFANNSNASGSRACVPFSKTAAKLS